MLHRPGHSELCFKNILHSQYRYMQLLLLLRGKSTSYTHINIFLSSHFHVVSPVIVAWTLSQNPAALYQIHLKVQESLSGQIAWALGSLV